MRLAITCLLLFGLAAGPGAGQLRPTPDFTGVWKLEMQGADPKAGSFLDLTMKEQLLTGQLKTPQGEFTIENGSVDGEDLFFNVVIRRDEYELKTTYRGHLFSTEIQFTVEAGERTLQVIARRAG